MTSQQVSAKQAGVAEIHELWRAQPADHVWIDVRQPEEWAEGTIPGVQRIQLGELPAALDQLDKNKTYVIVCRSGGRSGRACQAMEQAGFKQLINFAGGMLAWYQAGHPTE